MTDPVTIDDLRAGLQCLASDPMLRKPFKWSKEDLTGKIRSGMRRHGDSKSTEYIRLGSLKSINHEMAGISYDVVSTDLEQDDLIRQYADEALAVLNRYEVGALEAEARHRLAIIAAAALSNYSRSTPTIHVSGCPDRSYFSFKRTPTSSWDSWWSVRDYAPVIIGSTSGPRAVRSPLEQFLLRWLLLQRDSKSGSSQWCQVRSLSYDVTWSDFANPTQVSKQVFERWLRGEIAIPDDFLINPALNAQNANHAWLSDRRHLITIKAIQFYWRFGAVVLARRHDLLAEVFKGLMSIPYVGHIVVT